MPVAYATTTETLYLQVSASSTNNNCGAEFFNLQTSAPSSSSTFPTNPYYLCTSAKYTGPTLSVSSVEIVLYGVQHFCSSCLVSGSASLCAKFGLCSTSVYSFNSQSVSSFGSGSSCTSAKSITITPTSLGTLNPGNYIQAQFIFSSPFPTTEYPEICSGGSTSSYIMITGTPPSTGVPEFPLGVFGLLALTIPILIYLNSGQRRKMKDHAFRFKNFLDCLILFLNHQTGDFRAGRS